MLQFLSFDPASKVTVEGSEKLAGLSVVQDRHRVRG
jgi:hypothetical protein